MVHLAFPLMLPTRMLTKSAERTVDPQLIIHWLWSYDCIAAAEEALRAKSFGKNLACVEI